MFIIIVWNACDRAAAIFRSDCRGRERFEVERERVYNAWRHNQLLSGAGWQRRATRSAQKLFLVDFIIDFYFGE